MGYTKKDIYVGRTVYLTLGYNRARNNPDKSKIIEAKISKVGRKYFELDIKYSRARYFIEDLRQDTQYTEDYCIYLDKQVILDKREKSSLTSYMKSVFGYGGHTKEKTLTIDQLRRMKKIVEEGE